MDLRSRKFIVLTTSQVSLRQLSFVHTLMYVSSALDVCGGAERTHRQAPDAAGGARHPPATPSTAHPPRLMRGGHWRKTPHLWGIISL